MNYYTLKYISLVNAAKKPVHKVLYRESIVFCQLLNWYLAIINPRLGHGIIGAIGHGDMLQSYLITPPDLPLLGVIRSALPFTD